MAKRTRQKSAGGNSKNPPKKKPAKKTATPDNPAPEEKSAVSISPAYDAMPDEVEDPAAVFKLAFLEMKKAKCLAELAVTAQEHDKRVNSAELARREALNASKARLREAEDSLKFHKDHVEKTYGLALRCYSYDDETGVMTKKDILVEEAKKQDEERAKAAEEAAKKKAEDSPEMSSDSTEPPDVLH